MEKDKTKVVSFRITAVELEKVEKLTKMFGTRNKMFRAIIALATNVFVDGETKDN